MNFFLLEIKIVGVQKSQYCKNIAKRSINIFVPLFVEVKYGQYKIAHKVFRHNEKKKKKYKKNAIFKTRRR